MYTQGQEYQTGGVTTNYTTQQYNYEYQYQLPTTTQTTTTTQYTTQPVTYTTQQVTSQPVTYTTQQVSVPEYTQTYTQQNYTVSNVPGVVTSVSGVPNVVSNVQSFPSVVTTVSGVPSTVSGIGVSGPIKPRPAFQLLRQGSGISPNEQQGIVSTAMLVYQYGITPISNNTASRIKKTLGGDWIVIVYPQGKPVDFNMTCVQGNDYMYFTLDNWAYQVCRLR